MVSEPAAMVAADVVLIDLLTRERKKIHEQQVDISRSRAKVEERQRTMEFRQVTWSAETRGRCIVRLIRRLECWVDWKHGEVNFFVTQLLTNAGYFRADLNEMERVRNVRRLHYKDTRFSFAKNGPPNADKYS